MESRNPVFSRNEEFARGGYATFDTRTPSSGDLEQMYGAPTATSRDTGRMTYDDVIVRTATLFTILVATAAATYFALNPTAVVVFGSMIIGLVLGLVISFSKTVRPALILAYAAVEGVFVGSISDVYGSAFGPSIIFQAILGTLSAFAAMLVLYKIGAVRATPRFQRILLMAAVGYMVFAVVNLLGSAFDLFPSVYSVGGLAPIVSAFGVVLASLFLVLDFDFIEQGVRNGVPEKFAWTAAFGLVVTLVWLYLEILRLLAILRGDD